MGDRKPDRVQPDSHYTGGQTMRDVDRWAREQPYIPDAAIKLAHGATHLYRAAADGGNSAEYARGAGQIKEVFQGDNSLTAHGGEYQQNYGKKK